MKTTHTSTYADEYFQYLQGRTALRKFLRNAFIDVTYLEKHGLTENEFYRLEVKKRFPLNSELFGRYFTHNELRLVFDARK